MAETKRIVYLVTGESDQDVYAVFDRRDLAEAMTVSGGYRIEEYTLNPGEVEHAAGLSMWWVDLRKDGSIAAVHDCGFAHLKGNEPCISYEQDWNGSSFQFVAFIIKTMNWARNEAEAVKAANEVREQWIASGQWDAAELEIRMRPHWIHLVPPAAPEPDQP